MDPSMTVPRAIALVTILVLSGVIGLGTSGLASAAPVRPATAPAVTGNISGPSVMAYHGAATIFINGTGGPAIAPNGTRIGNLSWYAKLSASNLTGISLSPSSYNFTGTGPSTAALTVGNITEQLSITIDITSRYQSQNASTNRTLLVNIVQPYVWAFELVATSSVTVLPFNLTILLDGGAVGTLKIPTITSGSSYNASFSYPTVGLSSGWHTFSASLANEHGLVRFSNGTTSLSVSFYVPGSPPSYTLWYVAGAVAFFGAIFIFLTRVAARRRNPSKK